SQAGSSSPIKLRTLLFHRVPDRPDLPAACLPSPPAPSPRLGGLVAANLGGRTFADALGGLPGAAGGGAAVVVATSAVASRGRLDRLRPGAEAPDVGHTVRPRR